MTIAFNAVTSTTTQIDLEWNLLTTDEEIGGSALTSQTLEYDQGTSTWTTIAIGVSDTTKAVTVSSNVDYQFRIFATNIHGDGIVSPTITVKGAD